MSPAAKTRMLPGASGRGLLVAVAVFGILVGITIASLPGWLEGFEADRVLDGSSVPREEPSKIAAPLPHGGAATGAPGTKSDSERADARRDDALARLRKVLALERREAMRMRAEIAALQTELEDARALAQASPESPSPSESPSGESVRIDERSPLPPSHRTPQLKGAWFDRERLEGAGLTAREIEELHERWEDFAMEKLYLDDEARREGAVGTPRYREDRRAVEDAFREDVGEQGYDAYLYATGATNRVYVRSVIEDSPADLAGTAPGDAVIRYDGERVFKGIELKRATSRGDLDDLVLIEVLRDGRIVTLRVPRGPMGIQLEERSLPPLED